MKKMLQAITLVLMFAVFASHGIAQEQLLERSDRTTPGPVQTSYADKDGGMWINYFGELPPNENALGLGGDAVTNWNAAIRWMPDDLVDFEGWEVTRIRIFMNDEPVDAEARIWQGTMEEPVVYVSQAMMTAEEDWVEVELFDPYPIDTSQELWIGWNFGDEGDGHFPAAFSATGEHSPYSDLLQFGDNPWDNAASFGFETAWNIEAYVVPGEDPDPDPDPDTFSVTFNVDMTDVEGFDPEEHDVFVTGNFTGWAEPGTEGSLQMTMVDPAKDAPPYTFYENFDGYDDFTTDLSPWITLQLTEGNTWGVGDFSFPGEGEEWAWMVFNPHETDPAIHETDPPYDGSKMAMAIQYTDFDDDKWLISPEFSMHETSVLSFYARSHTHAYGAERFRVLVSTTGEDVGNFIPISDGAYIEAPTEWTYYEFELGDYAGETARFAINYVSEDAFIFFVDAITLHAEVDPDPDPDQIIYTATHDEVPAGTLLYKYFSTVIDEGWDGGEWEGDPNREVEITGDTVLDDIFADYITSVVDVDTDALNLMVFPNPATTHVNVKADGDILNVRIFDVSGRLVMQQDNVAGAINVSTLNSGLYIMQVTTPDGVASHRFNVAR